MAKHSLGGFRYLWNRADRVPKEHLSNITKAFNEWVAEKEYERQKVEARYPLGKNCIKYKRITDTIKRQRKAYNKTMKELNQWTN